MTQAREDVEHAAVAIARATQPEAVVSGDRADLSTEAVQLLVASRAFEAAAALAKTADEVAEATSDLLA
jgi:flagellar hook protein FlgE